MATTYLPTSTAASTALGYILEAMGARDTYDEVPITAMPVGTYVPERDALIVATPARAGRFRCAAELAAADRRLDILVLHVGDLDEGAVEVEVDLVLAALPHAPWPFQDLSIWSGPAGEVWLVPALFGPAIEVTPEGLMLDLIPPYQSLHERELGVRRAAHDIGRIFSPVEVR